VISMPTMAGTVVRRSYLVHPVLTRTHGRDWLRRFESRRRPWDKRMPYPGSCEDDVFASGKEALSIVSDGTSNNGYLR
jgi:hypothetical protein